MSIRNRTGYSFRSAIGNLEANHKKITTITNGFSPITDTASTFGHTKWTKLCAKAGSKPVFGIELAVTNSINDKKPGYDYWTFIAKDNLRAVHELLKIATNQFHYVPLLTFEQAIKAEGVFQIAGSKSNYSELPDNIYLPLSPSMNNHQMKKAIEIGEQRLVLMSDNRFIEPTDKDLYQIQLGRDAAVQTYPQWVMDDQELLNFFMEVKGIDSGPFHSAGLNRDRIFEATTAVQLKSTLLVPDKPKTLRQMCIDGAAVVGIDLLDEVYLSRMDRELDLIAKKNYEDYFYIIADMCQWARARMIVGPARGSSCGSLVCFLLQITTVDPIPYGLIFERFIDINREDLPDIDIDFSDTKREMVFKYMEEKYNPEHVARLGTVALLRPRSVLANTAAALDIPRWKIDKVADSIIKRSGGDARALQATEDTLKDTQVGRDLLKEYPEILEGIRMEGQPTHYSQHAAGVVITDRPIIDYVGIDSRTGATQCDKKDAEALGLLKIDALGLTQLSIFEDCLALAGMTNDDLFKIPLHDPLAFDVLNQHHYSGIFQFNGLALQSVTDLVKIESLNDIVAITALARPGPLNAGGTSQWIKVKTGKEQVSIPHPAFAPYLEETLGVVTYQEQVIRIGREVGDLSWSDASALRNAMSKSLGKETFDKYGAKWKVGALAKGIPQPIVDKVWDDLCSYGSWAFNKSHAVAYGIVSYYCCWLKAHHPVEFAAATLSHTDTIETQIAVLREMHAEGIDYVPVDAELSVANWTVGYRDNKKILIGPLSSVKGIGPKVMSQILSAKARGEPLSGRALKLLTNPKTSIDDLWPIESRLKVLVPDLSARNIFTPPTKIKKVQSNGEAQEVLVLCTPSQINPRDENEPTNIKKRGYEMKGPTAYLNLRLSDDTDTVFAKINRFDYETIATDIVNRGRPGKALYAIKGQIPKDFRMISVKQVRYLGDMEGKDE